ncbi:MAG: hypothetical protein AAGC63_16875 [Propionicimonas sp.]
MPRSEHDGVPGGIITAVALAELLPARIAEDEAVAPMPGRRTPGRGVLAG